MAKNATKIVAKAVFVYAPPPAQMAQLLTSASPKMGSEYLSQVIKEVDRINKERNAPTGKEKVVLSCTSEGYLKSALVSVKHYFQSRYQKSDRINKAA